MSFNAANKTIPNDKIIDIRRPSEWYETGVLDGSHLITFEMSSGKINPVFEQEVAKIFNKDDEIVLMCRSGVRSKAAMKLLENAGYKNVSDIDGGVFNYTRLGAKLSEYKG